MGFDYGPAPAVALEDVEWRIDGKPTGGDNPRCRFVPYIDSRTCGDLLDSWLGPGNWRDFYERADIGGKEGLWCHLEVRVGDEWVRKTDVGVPTNFEGQKGAVSDAFKRAACLKWGVGRNVYDLPGDIWAPCKMVGDKAYASDKTKPALLAELKKRGFEVGTVQTQEEGKASSDTDATPADTVSITAAQSKELVGRFDAITDPDARKKAKQNFASVWGAPKLLPETKYEAASESANAMIAALVEEKPPLGPQEDPGEGWLGVLPAHPETGETLYSVDEYLEGIKGYEDAMADITPWTTWLTEMKLDLEHVDQYQAWNAYTHIKTTVEGA